MIHLITILISIVLLIVHAKFVEHRKFLYFDYIIFCFLFVGGILITLIDLIFNF